MKTKTDDLLALICKAATERWPDDGLAPGVQIAHVTRNTYGDAREPFWYVALHRYPKKAGCVTGHDNPFAGLAGNRIVAHKAKHEDLDKAIQLLALELVPKNEAQAELAKALGVKP